MKGKLTHVTKSTNTNYFISSEKMKIFGKTFNKKAYHTRNNGSGNSTKMVCHYCDDKGHISPLCNIGNVKIPKFPC